MLLSEYTTRLKTIVHDFPLQFYGNPLSTTDIINQARKYVASKTKCIRVLVPSSSSVTTAVMTNNGSGYTTAPTVTFSAPQVINGVTATATANLLGNTVQNITITNPGSGYQSPPTITFSGGGGSGAACTAVIGNFCQTIASQEVYQYNSYNSLLPDGAATILGVISIAVDRGGDKPVLAQKSWTELQAYCRAYNTAYLDYPSVWANYQLGENGNFYLWPIPSSNYPIDLDVFCSPSPLVDDTSIDLIPYFWSESVAYYAAYLCYLYSQRAEDASRMFAESDRLIKEGTAFATPLMFPSFYEGWY